MEEGGREEDEESIKPARKHQGGKQPKRKAEKCNQERKLERSHASKEEGKMSCNG